jgi:hypothetical protein
MKRKVNNIGNDVENDSSNKRVKLDDKHICTLNKFIRLCKQKYNKYETSNDSSLLGISLKSIPLEYLIVEDKYFFDIRELYNISIHINNLCNPYTTKQFSALTSKYIKNIYRRKRQCLLNYKYSVIYNIKENISNLIAKVSNNMSKYGLIFNYKKILELTCIDLIELFDNISEYSCMDTFLNRYTDDIYNLFNNGHKERKIISLEKLYEIISYNDVHQNTRCIIIDECINNL